MTISQTMAEIASGDDDAGVPIQRSVNAVREHLGMERICFGVRR
jgi:hypothetical protein